MEITFIWSWLSFWIGVTSVFGVTILLVIVVAAVQSARSKKGPSADDFERWASKLK
jgi:hypothetical protein